MRSGATMPRADVVVIGAGLAGLTCAAELAESGARVFLAAKGMATTHWTHGGLDVAAPAGSSTPRVGVRVLAALPGHPYATVHPEIEAAVEAHRARLARAGHVLAGSLDSPHTPIPTALGSLRAASILPSAQAAAVAPWADDGLLLVGFAEFRDAWPAYAARNLGAVGWPGGPRRIRHTEVTLPGLERLNNLDARSLAVLFDDAAWRAVALGAIGRALPAGAWRIGLPAVLGIADHPQAHAEVEAAMGHRAFEIPSLPPSVPGMRLFDALRRAILDAGGRVQVGFDVVDVERDGRRIVAVHTEAAARTLRLEADAFVLATGGIGGTGTRANADGSLHERVFGLAVEAPPRAAWFSDDPLTPHPLESVGIRVDAELRPLDPAGHVAYENVRVIGSALAGMRYLEQRCGDGVALASAHRAARSLATGRLAA
jgi:glycerol-3-phosphate dehydrogenase subunit B